MNKLLPSPIARGLHMHLPEQSHRQSYPLSIHKIVVMIFLLLTNLLAATTAFGFAVGNRVQASGVVNVRSAAAGSFLGTQASGNQGTIIGGPTTASLSGTAYTWWAVDWDAGVDGWVADVGLSAVATPALSITTTAPNPATATVGVGYTAAQAIAATGGQAPYGWSASGLPNGMGINAMSGALFGTPTAAGTFNFTVTVTDSSSPQKSASKALSITVNQTTPALSITTTAPNPATAMVGTGYAAAAAIAATGGQTPYNWSASGLPNGMGINAASCALFGTPTAAGTFNFTVTVTDSSSPQKSASKGLSITVNPATSALSITTTAPNPATATVGTGYAAAAAMAATGGQTPYSWSASGLPNGMAINASSGALFGVPTVAGTFNFTVTVIDSSSPQKSASKGLSITVSNTTVTNTAPFGDLDTPVANANVTGVVAVSGWVLDQESTALTVELLIDNQVVSSNPARSPRSDVCRVYSTVPICATSQPGFSFSWNTAGLSNSSHSLAIRVTDPFGQLKVFGTRTIIVNNGASNDTLGSAIVTEANKHTEYVSDKYLCNVFSTYFHRKCEDWCADFSTFVWEAAGASIVWETADGNQDGLDATTLSFYRYGLAHGTWKPGADNPNVKPGDAVIWGIGFEPGEGVHVGLVTKVNDDKSLSVINGNFGEEANQVSKVITLTNMSRGYTIPFNNSTTIKATILGYTSAVR